MKRRVIKFKQYKCDIIKLISCLFARSPGHCARVCVCVHSYSPSWYTSINLINEKLNREIMRREEGNDRETVLMNNAHYKMTMHKGTVIRHLPIAHCP